MPNSSEVPCFSVREAAEICQREFAKPGRAKPLFSYSDQNFLFTQEDGQRFILKIAHGETPEAYLDFQEKFMARLHRNPQIRIPRLIPNRDGNNLCFATDESGRAFGVRLISFLEGTFCSQLPTRTADLRRDIGRIFAKLDRSLSGLTHPAMNTIVAWDLQNAEETCKRNKEFVRGPARRRWFAYFANRFSTEVKPFLSHLRRSVIHNDGNNENIMVDETGRVSGVIDFGDIVFGPTVSEVAVCCAYAMLHEDDPLSVACQVVAGYHEELPLTELELRLIFDLMAMRLCLSLCNSASQRSLHPENEYISISEKPGWACLEKLAAIHPNLAHYRLRAACGLTPCPAEEDITAWLRDRRGRFSPVIACDLTGCKKTVFDFRTPYDATGDGPKTMDSVELNRRIFQTMAAEKAPVGLGRYNEDRNLYDGFLFEEPWGERRTIHLGLDLFQSAGSPVFACWAGVIHGFADNHGDRDYGPTILLRHETDPDGPCFYTLYGHLSRESLDGLKVGRAVTAGTEIGCLGSFSENGGWPPHLHFQIICDPLDRVGDFPGVASRSARETWLSLSPDPNLILDIPELDGGAGSWSTASILRARRRHLAPSLSLAYGEPLHMVSGRGAYLYDAEGKAYLDLVNNVCHVGHCHPRVVRAAHRQMRLLNTNTRYLHRHLVSYARRLCQTMPAPLCVCFFVCTGSEANELALRLAKTHTGREDVLVVDHAYHGHTHALIQMSPYKFQGPGGSGPASHIHKLPIPDGYRGLHGYEDEQQAVKYASHVGRAIAAMNERGRAPAAFFCESLPGCAGQIVLPQGYLHEAYTAVRAAGGLCVADEVQVGFGRVGSHMWGFQTQAVVPDIVTLGKPMGNGHPLAAVVTTAEVAASFHNGMEYFNTFGGNPVSCAVGEAVLDVIEDEGLREHALQMGRFFKQGLEQLKEKFALIGDVRGLGLFIGVELVRDRETLAPAAHEAAVLIEAMKERGFLLSRDGPLHNVIKIKPPLVIRREDVERVLFHLERVLTEI